MKDMYSSLLPNLKANKERKGDNEECKKVILNKFQSPLLIRLVRIVSLYPNTPHSLGEVGQVLCDFSDECERACCAVVWILLHQIEQRGGHDGGTEEPQKQGGADQTLADVWATPVAALLTPRRKHLFQLPWKYTVEEGTENEHHATWN